MSTFGEIVEPSSRATWEDWDDSGSHYPLPELGWQKPLQISEEVDKFFLFEGKCLWNGMRTKENTHEVNCIKEANLHLYRTPGTNNYICVIRDCDVLLCNNIVKLLQDVIIKGKMVVTVQEKPLSEYQTSQTPVSYQIIRKIITTNTLNLLKVDYIPKLEQPNIISGVSAGVFTLREHLNLSATALVLYMEQSQGQLEVIDSLLQNLNISGIPQMKPNVVLNSNLYI